LRRTSLLFGALPSRKGLEEGQKDSALGGEGGGGKGRGEKGKGGGGEGEEARGGKAKAERKGSTSEETKSDTVRVAMVCALTRACDG